LFREIRFVLKSLKVALICEDLERYGVVLVAPTSERYFELLADIERALSVRPKGAAPVDAADLSRISEHDTRGSAILLNQASVAIASMATVWWSRGRDGDILPFRRLPGTNPSVLLPFALDPRQRIWSAYWHTILPASKRLLTVNEMYGDNTDVRPPVGDELWSGGSFRVSAGLANDQEPLKLTIDGVFFADGGFAGPNQLGSWEQATMAMEAYLDCAALAREALEKHTDAERFFGRIGEFTGCTEASSPPPPLHLNRDPAAIRAVERYDIGKIVLWTRKRMDDGKALAQIAAWSSVPAPKLHKL